MLSHQETETRRQESLELFRQAGIIVTPQEAAALEIADFGLGEFATTGLGVLVYVNTSRCCAKELTLLPGQTCPEHRHPPLAGEPGKEETFRCRWGEVYLYVPGPAAASPRARLPEHRRGKVTVWHEIVLRPGDQYTLQPNTLHWFQGGPRGAVVSEFSTRSRDEADIFTDPDIQRITQIADR